MPAWKDWRPDAAEFPASVRGAGVDGWPGEQWLDIRNIGVLQPLMAARFDECELKGFDAVEPDNIDGYTSDTGFPLTATNQIPYNTMLAGLAHDRGLAIGLKNDVDQVQALVGTFDFAVNEECNAYDECETLLPFIAAGKPVFNVEYSGSPSSYCPALNALQISSIRKDLDLDATRQSC